MELQSKKEKFIPDPRNIIVLPKTNKATESEFIEKKVSRPKLNSLVTHSLEFNYIRSHNKRIADHPDKLKYQIRGGRLLTLHKLMDLYIQRFWEGKIVEDGYIETSCAHIATLDFIGTPRTIRNHINFLLDPRVGFLVDKKQSDLTFGNNFLIKINPELIKIIKDEPPEQVQENNNSRETHLKLIEVSEEAKSHKIVTDEPIKQGNKNNTSRKTVFDITKVALDTKSHMYGAGNQSNTFIGATRKGILSEILKYSIPRPDT